MRKMMTFFTGFDKGNKRHTLTSTGVVGKPNVEEFTSKRALDYKVKKLEKKGYRVIEEPKDT
jgi:hypothetical protein